MAPYDLIYHFSVVCFQLNVSRFSSFTPLVHLIMHVLFLCNFFSVTLLLCSETWRKRVCSFMLFAVYRVQELLDKNQREKMLENLRYLENPKLLELYGTLFADSSKSLWSGPHSLVGQKQEGSNRRSSFISTISSYMK